MGDFGLNSLKEVGGIFKFGRGVLGKSAVVLAVLLVAFVVAVMRLHSDGAIIAVLVMGIALFTAWLVYILRFAGKHPDIALLEGAEWSGFQRFQAVAKGYIPSSTEQNIVATPTGSQPSPAGDISKEPDTEIK